MKITRVAVLGIAVIAGGVAAVLALNLTRPPAPVQTAQLPPSDLVQVLVAASDLPLGTTLTQASVTWQDWPKTGVNPNFITKQPNADASASFVGAIARGTFYAGEPINNAKLITSDKGFLAAILPVGMRAAATKITADTSAGGFILPNDRVDVVMTRKATDTSGGTNNANATYTTQTILNNVRVLAIDQTIEEKDGSKVVVGQTATLELTPQQVEILTVAQQISDRLTLALRSIQDSNHSPADAAADAVDLIGGGRQHETVTVIKSGVAHQEAALH